MGKSSRTTKTTTSLDEFPSREGTKNVRIGGKKPSRQHDGVTGDEMKRTSQRLSKFMADIMQDEFLEAEDPYEAAELGVRAVLGRRANDLPEAFGFDDEWSGDSASYHIGNFTRH
ncbi:MULTISPECIES: hypothetical protein [Rhizobium]|uniref:hypothetical protein n=1 Tax=Rhizobium TaxID=379 RepID=UPI00103D7499|nr:hypothetical protein [Rhizobium leguminosarum]TBZ57136.1 hypothetical protein E0H48_16885 [Rhizobium leguminosarum bv. viciae]